MTNNQAAFDKFEREYLRTQEWTDIDLFQLIGQFAGVDPKISMALAFHTADILSTTHEEVDYTELIGEIYRRTFFDLEYAKKYGTDVIAGDPNALTHFVEYLVTQKRIAEEGHSNVIPFAPVTAQ